MGKNVRPEFLPIDESRGFHREDSVDRIEIWVSTQKHNALLLLEDILTSGRE